MDHRESPSSGEGEGKGDGEGQLLNFSPGSTPFV